MTYERFPLPDDDEDALQGGAATEMTGLIPSGRPDADERESYQDVLPFIPPFGMPRPAI